MYEEHAERIGEFAVRLAELRACLNIEDAKARIAQLEQQMAAPGFWNDAEAAKTAVQNLKALKSLVSAPDEIFAELTDGRELIELAQAEEDISMGAELDKLIENIGARLHKLEFSSLFGDPRDEKSAIVNIHPGAGGTESCDWASMLYRMILRYCERQEFPVEIIDYLEGEEAGLKSATLLVNAPFAYGNLKSESGVHRLVRISPFDAQSRRHTSFAAIEVLAQIDEDIDVEIREEDLKFEAFRASGPGGQKVNKTSSAVRITHLPSGIVVACQTERSQHRNRDTAIQLLKAQLYDMELKKKEAELAAQREGQRDVAWGSQIRSYVLHPYQLIKDHRTEYETGNVDRVLDGELDGFIEAYLKWNLEKKGQLKQS